MLVAILSKYIYGEEFQVFETKENGLEYVYGDDIRLLGSGNLIHDLNSIYAWKAVLKFD